MDGLKCDMKDNQCWQEHRAPLFCGGASSLTPLGMAHLNDLYLSVICQWSIGFQPTHIKPDVLMILQLSFLSSEVAIHMPSLLSCVLQNAWQMAMLLCLPCFQCEPWSAL